MHSRLVVWSALAVSLALVFSLWLGGVRTPPQTPPRPAQTTPVPAPMQSAAEPGLPPSRAPSVPATSQHLPPQPIHDWEVKIDDALRSGATPAQAAQTLIQLLPTLPDAAKIEAAEHVTNLLDDASYRSLLPVLVNTALPSDLHEILFTDLLNRPDNAKLPALLEIAKLPSHPMRQEALDTLEILLDADYGNDWAKWQAAIDAYLPPAKNVPQ